jgi:hypothetical protein
MADPATISSIATAGGTLVLAIATFSSVRSANRSARVAERTLLAAQRPVLIPSREDDPVERVGFADDVVLHVPGHGSALELRNDRIYIAIALRNGGSGLAVIHGWGVDVRPTTADAERPELSAFRRQQRDLFIPAGESGFWQGAIRDRSDPDYGAVRAAIEHREHVMVDLLYGDHEGGQRAIARFGVGRRAGEEPSRAEVLRYWNVDGADPR